MGVPAGMTPWWSGTEAVRRDRLVRVHATLNSHTPQTDAQRIRGPGRLVKIFGAVCERRLLDPAAHLRHLSGRRRWATVARPPECRGDRG